MCQCTQFASFDLLHHAAKGPADHAMSKASGKDCELARVFGEESVCVPKKPPPPVEDRSIQVGESK